MRDDAQHVIGVARYHVVAGDARLETERRALDRRRDLGAGRRRPAHRRRSWCSWCALRRASPARRLAPSPSSPLKCAVEKGIGGVDDTCRCRREIFSASRVRPGCWPAFPPSLPTAGAKRRTRLLPRDPRFHLRHICHQRMPQLLPIIGRDARASNRSDGRGRCRDPCWSFQFCLTINQLTCSTTPLPAERIIASVAATPWII